LRGGNPIGRDVGSAGGRFAGTSQDGIDEASAEASTEAAKISGEIEELRALAPQARAARLQDVHDSHLATLLRVVRRNSAEKQQKQQQQASPAGAAATGWPSDDEDALVSAATYHAHHSARVHSFNLGVRRAPSSPHGATSGAVSSEGDKPGNGAGGGGKGGDEAVLAALAVDAQRPRVARVTTFKLRHDEHGGGYMGAAAKVKALFTSDILPSAHASIRVGCTLLVRLNDGETKILSFWRNRAHATASSRDPKPWTAEMMLFC